jgi:fatty acid desaturase
MQPLLTVITGKPLAYQKSWQVTPTYHLVTALMSLSTGVLISIFATFNFTFLPLLIFSWILTVSGARKLQLTIVHQCAHERFSGNSKLDKWLGETISILLVIQDFDSYQKEHLEDHHDGHNLSTPQDPTVKFLVEKLGLQPGMSKEQLWEKLIVTIFSPFFHIRFFLNRLSSSLCSPNPVHNAKSWLLKSLLLGLVAITNSWSIFLVAWVLPLTILYQISASLRLCAEHCYPESEHYQQRRNKRIISRLTLGIFLGEPTPNSSNDLQWIVWWLRMIFIHLFCRVFVMVCDTPCHDRHHRHPTSIDWPNYIFARQQELDKGCPGWPENYREVWGLFNAIDYTFETLSQLPPY